MNQDVALRLQAYLDGELAGAEKAGMEAQLARDPELKALAAELRMVGASLRESDPVVAVPASREFYWSQVQRRIESAEAAAERPVAAGGGFAGWLRRAMLPLSGVAAACLMLTLSLRQGSLPVASLHEDTESPLDETSAVTFRSESEKVTVVWLYDKEQASVENTTETVN